MFVRTLLGLVLGGGVWAQVAGAEAVPGEPFGVAHISLSGDIEATTNQVDGLRCSTPNGQVLYPVFARPGTPEASADPRRPTDLYFLFRGAPPRQVTVYSPLPRTYPLRVGNARQHRRLLTRWWRAFRNETDRQFEHGLVPPSAATYFREMLASRVQPEERFSRLRQRVAEREAEQADTWRALEFLFGLERLRTDALADLWGMPAEPRDQALPPGLDVERLPAGRLVDSIEPIAMHVPEDSFYLRFGSFANYLWFQRLLDENGGDLATMVTLRSTDDRPTERLQQQLGLKQSALADILGGRVIEDVALIGYDLYTKDGAALGILFHAKNELLGVDLNKQRRAALRAAGGNEQEIVVDDNTVSFMSTADNQLRSFYVQQGRFHLVTNCRVLAEAFVRAPKEGRVLGNLPQFQDARRFRPADSGDTLFAYFSTPFFLNLTSPHYQVELSRRFESEAARQILALAGLAAISEGLPVDLEALRQQGLLPAAMDDRFVRDRFQVVEGEFVDRVRGRQGSWLPIPDVPMTAISARERRMVDGHQRFYRENWRQFDPLMFAAQRHRTEQSQRERISLTVQASPFDQQKLAQFTSRLAAPTTKRLTPAPGDIVFVQAALQGGATRPELGTHHFLFGLQESPTAWPLPPDGFWDTLQLIRATPAYLASWPSMGLLDMLPFRWRSEPDPWGFQRLPLGLWRLDRGLYTSLGFHRDVLGWAADHLQVVEGEQPAQVRLFVGDLSQSSVRPFLDGLQYNRAVLSSIGGAQWMNYLGRQLNLDVDNARAVAEQLTGSTPLCPLGGEYRVVGEGPAAYWTSSALLGDPETPEFAAPVLQWFRGMAADLVHEEGTLRVRAELDLQRKKTESLLSLPLFNLAPQQRPDVLPPPQRKPGDAEEVPPGTPQRTGKGPVKF